MVKPIGTVDLWSGLLPIICMFVSWVYIGVWPAVLYTSDGVRSHLRIVAGKDPAIAMSGGYMSCSFFLDKEWTPSIGVLCKG